MSPPPASTTMATELPGMDPSMRIGAVHLAVGDLPRSVDFYERVLGLPVISKEANGARLGPRPTGPLLELTGLSHPRPAPLGATGLFHVAWLHPSRAALAATVRRVAQAGWPIDGASDHGVSEALYLSDPDGLGIEIYADRPRERWERGADGQGVRMVNLPLDLDDLMAQAEAEPTGSIRPDTEAGHVHLKVSDVPRAVAFYRDGLGLQEQAQLPSAGFLSAGGYHHHVGLNSWHSRGGGRPPDDVPGLRLVEFELGEADALSTLERRLSETPGSSFSREQDGALTVLDPDGQPLAFHL